MTDAVQISILGALALPDPAGEADLPDWIHLIPKGQVKAYDGRGPWSYEDAGQVIAASFEAAQRIHIDENHSTETAAKAGISAPARGYIREMEERDDGIWGRVEWTATGAELLRDKAYWGISPVFAHTKAGKILRIKNAALTNDPALSDLTALNSANMENGMTFLQKLAKKLGLGEDASEEDVLAAVAQKGGGESATAAQAMLSAMTTALGIKADASDTEVMTRVVSLSAANADLTAQITTLQAELSGLKEGDKLRAAEAFVAKAIAEKRAGVLPSKDHWVKLHQENPETAEAMMAAQPQLTETHATDTPPAGGGETISALTADQKLFAEQMGFDEAEYLAQLQADAKTNQGEN
ncbi:MAG: phage protease [Pelagimonas sp.]|jgi:phage I-like protein|nr:phage protease [Pelagimonas sp.]